MALLVTLLALGAIVALHEFGHLLVARACGMRVDRYSIGFGPVLLSWKLGEIEYALSMLPLGGYVKIAGMNPHDGTAEDDPRSYANRPAWQRFLVLAAGPSTNYLLAFLVLVGLYAFGMPRPTPQPIIGEVVPSSAAALAGLKPDDLFLSIGDKPVGSFEEVRAQIQASGGKATAVKVRRGAQELTFDITPRPVGAGFQIGASPKTFLQRLPFGESLAAAGRDTLVSNLLLLGAIADKLRGRPGLELGGPVAAVTETTAMAHLGLAPFLLTVASLSVGVALFNLLPVPALDGGRIFFVLIELVRRKPVNPRFETAVHAVGFLLLLGLMAFLTVGDVRKHLPGASPSADAGPQAGH